MSKEVTNSVFRYLGIHARKQSRAFDVYVNDSRFALPLHHGSRFLNWITNGPTYRVTISPVTIERRKSERHSMLASPEIARPVYQRFLTTALVAWSMRWIAINDLAAEAPPVLPVLPACPAGAGSRYFHVRIRPRFRFIRDWFYERPRRDVVVWYIGIAVVILVLAPPGVINIRYRTSYFTS